MSRFFVFYDRLLERTVDDAMWSDLEDRLAAIPLICTSTSDDIEVRLVPMRRAARQIVRGWNGGPPRPVDSSNVVAELLHVETSVPEEDNNLLAWVTLAALVGTLGEKTLTNPNVLVDQKVTNWYGWAEGAISGDIIICVIRVLDVYLESGDGGDPLDTLRVLFAQHLSKS